MAVKRVQVHSVIGATVHYDDESGRVLSVSDIGLTDGGELYEEAERGCYDLDTNEWTREVPWDARSAGFEAIAQRLAPLSEEAAAEELHSHHDQWVVGCGLCDSERVSS